MYNHGGVMTFRVVPSKVALETETVMEEEGR